VTRDRTGMRPAAPEAGEAAEAAVRWPAEWEPHTATWLSWPKSRETWPGVLERVEAVYARIVEALVDAERVRVLVDDSAAEDRARSLLRAHGVDPAAGVDFFHVPTDDAWIRDYGPTFVLDAASGEPVLVDFGFNAWGGKYPPWTRDEAASERIAASTRQRRRAVDAVLEGGSIDGDGRGTVLTTESCLLNPNRVVGAPPRRREDVEQLLSATLGTECVIWLGDGIVGDDTDGHVDDIARFVAPGVVVAAVEEDTGDANHAALAANLERLRGSRDAAGRPLDVVELPMPAPVHHAGDRLPASYANFYVGNAAVLLPVFAQPSDARAAAVLAECFPRRAVVGIPSADLVVGLGAVHCLTQQEPRMVGLAGGSPA